MATIVAESVIAANLRFAAGRAVILKLAANRAIRVLSPTLATTLGIQVLNLVAGIIVARTLGPIDRGNLALVILWPTLFAIVGGLSVYEAVPFFVAANTRGRLLASAMLLGTVQSAVIVVVAVGVLLHLYSPQSRIFVLSVIYLLYIPALLVVNHSLAIYQGKFAMLAYNIIRLLPSVLYCGAVAALALSRSVTLEAVVIVSLASQSFPLVGATVLLSWRGWLSSRPSAEIIRRLIGFGGRLHVGNMATALATRVDLLVLSFAATTKELGFYVVAMSAATAATAAPGAVALLMYPAASRANPDRAQGILRETIWWGAVGSVLLTPVLAFAVPWALPRIYGLTYLPAAPVAALLVIGQVVRTWSLILTAYLRGRGKPLTASGGEVIALLVLAVSVVVLAPSHGAAGAALAVCIAAPCGLVWVLWMACRESGMRPPGLDHVFGAGRVTQWIMKRFRTDEAP